MSGRDKAHAGAKAQRSGDAEREAPSIPAWLAPWLAARSRSAVAVCRPAAAPRPPAARPPLQEPCLEEMAGPGLARVQMLALCCQDALPKPRPLGRQTRRKVGTARVWFGEGGGVFMVSLPIV